MDKSTQFEEFHPSRAGPDTELNSPPNWTKLFVLNSLIHMKTSHQRTIFHLVEDQFGYLTTEMAREAGISVEQLAQLTRRGTLERVSRGVYHLVEFPPSPLDSYMAATLWPQGVEGTLTHDTALDLFDVCNINPMKVHLTVPRDHRIRRKVPGLYIIHHANLPDGDIYHHDGIRITTLRRTLADCIADGVGTYLIDQAIERGRQLGYLNSEGAKSSQALLDARGRPGAAHG